MPRLLRDAPLNGIWEGSGNVIALDVLRATERDAGWVPLNATPMHPEYPSQAGINVGAAVGVRVEGTADYDSSAKRRSRSVSGRRALHLRLANLRCSYRPVSTGGTVCLVTPSSCRLVSSHTDGCRAWC